MSQENLVPTLNHKLFTDFGRYVTSEIFVLVAADDARFYIHKDILTSQSQPFQEATKGESEEERKIELKEWDRDTVARLVQFLYTGDYQYPDPVLMSALPKPEVIDEDADSPRPQREKPESQPAYNRPLTPLDKCFERLVSPIPNNRVWDCGRLVRFSGSECGYRVVLLSHASIYALACYKSIAALQMLALRRVFQTISTMKPIEPGSRLLSNIVDLARYTYAHTTWRAGSQEPLRKLISQFIALNFGVWQTEPTALELMGEGGDLVKDVMVGVSRRLMNFVAPEVVNEAAPEKLFISRLNAVRGTPGQSLPPGHVQALHGQDSNLNYPLHFPVWFVPEYTTKEYNACTAFKTPSTLMAASEILWDASGQDMGFTLYLEALKEDSVMKKITEVALVRSQVGAMDLASVVGYSGMSANIGRPGTWLYLVWKSVKVA